MNMLISILFSNFGEIKAFRNLKNPLHKYIKIYIKLKICQKKKK